MKTTINVSDMTCGHCVKAVKNIILDIDGVEAVEVSLENANATIEYTNLEVQKVIDELNKTNYKASI